MVFLTCDCDRFENGMITHRNFHARTNFMCVAHYQLEIITKFHVQLKLFRKLFDNNKKQLQKPAYVVFVG